MKRLLRFLRAEDGPTAVEYAVMLALLLLAAIGSIALVGQQTHNSLGESSDLIEQSFSHVK